ncbi:hypothetical protein Y981_08340 [Leptospirillum ferriphilum YSK]|uniref:Uncharacterized protein n=1 Tax=Leptospirillum ferriphilum YSK TaxID=1441628 RepID=A0A059XT91_9BACT|nr:hypothetical protein Y981_08340 [Leptospirillum ferriphilum YSK]
MWRGRDNLVLLKALSSFMRQIRLFFSSRVRDILPEIPFDRSLAFLDGLPKRTFFPGGGGRLGEALSESQKFPSGSLCFSLRVVCLR